MNSTHFKLTSLAVLLAVALSGCGSIPAIDDIVPDNTKEYRRAETMPPLDVPPDLSTSRINDDIAGSQKSSATYSEFEEAATNPLATKYNITPETKPALTGEGDKRHLMVPNEREATWQHVLDFWQEKGVELKRQDIRIGMMDTVVGSDDYAYRVRVERGDTSKRTKVFVSGASFDVNPQKDEAMLRQLADFLGGLHQEEVAQAKIEQQSQPYVATVNATLIDEAGGHQSLQVEQDFTDVWKSVGRILDSKGFAVEDRDRSRGLYFVRYIDPFQEAKEDDDSILDTLAFWRDDEDVSPEEFYYIKLISDAQETKIIILDTEEVRMSSDTAKRLLSLMQEQLAQ